VKRGRINPGMGNKLSGAYETRVQRCSAVPPTYDASTRPPYGSLVGTHRERVVRRHVGCFPRRCRSEARRELELGSVHSRQSDDCPAPHTARTPVVSCTIHAAGDRHPYCIRDTHQRRHAPFRDDAGIVRLAGLVREA